MKLSRVALFTAFISIFLSFFVSPPSKGVVAAGKLEVNFVEPNIPKPGNIVSFGGTVANTGDVALSNLGIRIFLSNAINSRSTLNNELSVTEERSSLRDTGQRIEIGNLSIGEQASWSAVEMVDDLLTNRDGVYVIGFQFETDSTVLDFKKIAVPYIQELEDEIVPVGISLIWPVASPIKTDWQGALPNENLPESIINDGRLANILRAGQLNQVSWVIDPALVEFLNEASDGYKVKDSSGALVDGEYAEELNLFLNGLQISTQTTEVWALPFANSDISALNRHEANSAFDQVLNIAKPLVENNLEVSVNGVVSISPGGGIPSDVIGLANSKGLSSALVNDTKYPPIVGTLFTPSGIAEVNTNNGRKKVLLNDSLLGELFSYRIESQEDRILLRQRILSDTYLIASQFNNFERVIVVSPDPYWSPNPETSRVIARNLTRAPWVRPVLLSEVLSQEVPNVLRSEYQFDTADLNKELPAEHIKNIKRAQGLLAELAAIYTDPAPIDGFAKAILQSSSNSFRTNRNEAEIYLNSIVEALLENKSKVQILAQGSIVLPQDEGSIPITIANDLDQKIIVRLQAKSNPELRFSAADLGLIEIEPGAKRGLTLESKVVGSGVVDVELQLLTPTGDEFGEPVIISVQSAAYSQVATWIAAIAFFALVLLSINSFRKRRKENV